MSLRAFKRAWGCQSRKTKIMHQGYKWKADVFLPWPNSKCCWSASSTQSMYSWDKDQGKSARGCRVLETMAPHRLFLPNTWVTKPGLSLRKALSNSLLSLLTVQLHRPPPLLPPWWQSGCSGCSGPNSSAWVALKPRSPADWELHCTFIYLYHSCRAWGWKAHITKWKRAE